MCSRLIVLIYAITLTACGGDSSGKQDAPSGACGSGTQLCEGACVNTSSDPGNCGTCGHTCSGGGGGCTSGSCTTTCPTALCGGSCCASDAICFKDAVGNSSCAKSCTSSDQCPQASPCCAPLTNGDAACVTNADGGECRCTSGAECTSNACGPAVDTSGNPVGPMVCKANDGQPYDGCNGATTCAGSEYCCVEDNANNLFCASQCTNSTMCGAAHCNPYSFAHTTCGGPDACGP